MSQSDTRSTALSIPVSAGLIIPTNVGEALEFAKMIAHSGMVPKQYDGKPGAVLVAIQMGAELGLSPMASIQNIAVINGRPSLWGDAMLAIVTSHHLCESVTEWHSDDRKSAYCRVLRRGREPVERSFSVDDARAAGLWGKQGPWTQYPQRMLQMRARGFALRDSFPDLLRGITPAEEAIDIVDRRPEFVEPTEGVHRARKTNTADQPAAVAKPVHPRATTSADDLPDWDMREPGEEG